MIAAIDDETSDLLGGRERAALRFAEKLAVDHLKVDDALWADLRSHFSEAEIIELAVHAALCIGIGRFNEVLGLTSWGAPGAPHPPIARATPAQPGRPSDHSMAPRALEAP